MILQIVVCKFRYFWNSSFNISSALFSNSSCCFSYSTALSLARFWILPADLFAFSHMARPVSVGFVGDNNGSGEFFVVDRFLRPRSVDLVSWVASLDFLKYACLGCLQERGLYSPCQLVFLDLDCSTSFFFFALFVYTNKKNHICATFAENVIFLWFGTIIYLRCHILQNVFPHLQTWTLAQSPHPFTQNVRSGHAGYRNILKSDDGERVNTLCQSSGARRCSAMYVYPKWWWKGFK